MYYFIDVRKMISNNPSDVLKNKITYVSQLNNKRTSRVNSNAIEYFMPLFLMFKVVLANLTILAHDAGTKMLHVERFIKVTTSYLTTRTE